MAEKGKEKREGRKERKGEEWEERIKDGGKMGRKERGKETRLSKYKLDLH